jgi:hypothetical protein
LLSTKRENKIEGTHLPDLPLTRESEDKDQEHINNRTPNDIFPPRERKKPHAFQLTKWVRPYKKLVFYPGLVGH